MVKNHVKIAATSFTLTFLYRVGKVTLVFKNDKIAGFHNWSINKQIHKLINY